MKRIMVPTFIGPIWITIPDYVPGCKEEVFYKPFVITVIIETIILIAILFYGIFIQKEG
jgi:hypothetical protein